MDLFSLGFVLLILVASGGIAFVADGLGKKIGKKRLSVAGLRPKHVAQLGTVGMGVVVSALTIGLIALFSHDARTWLRKGRGLIVEVQSLQEKGREAQAENARLDEKGRQLQAVNSGLTQTVEGLKTNTGRLRDGLKKEKALLESERASLAVVKAQRESLVAERRRLLKQAASLRTRADAARRQYEQTSGLLATAQTKLSTAKAALALTQKNYAIAVKNTEVAYKNANAALVTSLKTSQQNHALEAEVADRQLQVEDLMKKRDVLIKERDDAEARVADAKKQYAVLLAQLGEAGNRLAVMQDQLDQLQVQQDFFVSATKYSRTESMTFRRGEELARVVVPGGSDTQATELALTQLLRAARQEAVARGAKALRSKGQSYEAADIVDRKDPKTGEVIDAETLRRAVVATATEKPGDQVIVAYSTFNAFAGEPVSLDLDVLANPLVYRRNETVAEAQIDGTQPEDRILAQLSEFMAGRVRDRAVRDKMIPRAGTTAPFGELSTFEVLNLVRDVKQRGKSVRVTAVADRDVHAADPLRLEFRVR